MTKKAVTISPSQLIRFLDQELKELPDKRKGDNKKYTVNHALKAGFSVFFLLSPSFLQHQRLMKQKKGYDFIFVAKPSSHKALYEWIDFSEKNGTMRIGSIKKYEKGQRRIYRYRYVNQVPLRENEPSLMVNWYEVEIFDTVKNKVIYKNSFITNHELSEQNIFKMIVSGRTRWKVENESNNILKNQGYNLEHNFGHGQENLSEILLSLNLLAFLFHNVLDLVNSMYQKAREILGTIKRFFNDIRALLNYVCFQSWNDLFIFILTQRACTHVGESREPVNTS